MSDEKIVLSIIITAHNEGIYLHKSVLSIERALELIPEKKYEIILSLDNPDSETIRVANSLKKNKNIVIFKSSFGNPADNRNFAISKANGKFITLLDGDDLISREWFKNGLDTLKKNKGAIVRPEIHAMFGSYMNSLVVWKMRNSSNKDIDAIQMSYWNIWTLPLISETKTVKSILFKRPVDGFGFEDYLFNCEAIAKNIPIIIAPRTTFFYRQRPNVSVSTKHMNTVLDYSSLFDISYFKSLSIPDNQTNKISNNSIKQNFKKTYRFIYDAAKKSQRIKKILSPTAVKLLYNKQLKRLPDFFINDWREINKIENQLYPTKEKIAQIEYHPLTFNPFENSCGIIYKKLCDQISNNSLDYLFLVPEMSGRGGTEKLIANYIKAIKETHPDWNIGILSTHPFNSLTIEYFSNLDVDMIDFGKLTANIGNYEKNIIWSRILIQSKVKNLHLVNNEYWYRWLSEHKSVIKQKNINLNISLFMREFNSERDHISSFADPYLAEVWDIVNLVFTDNQKIIDQALENNAFEKSKFRVHYQPENIDIISPKIIDPSKKTKVLWASRVALQKRPDLLKKISNRISKDFEIDAYGIIEKRQYSKNYFNDSHVNYKGSFNGIKSINTHDYDIYLYTSQTDGIPNILLEISAAGLPIVASNIGGISEFIEDNKSGLLVDMENIDEYIKSLEYLRNNPDEAKKMVELSHKTLQTQHSWTNFINNVRKDI